MKKREYTKPIVKVRPIMYDGDVCETLPIGGGSVEEEAWGKEHDFDEDNFDDESGYEPYSVWED